MNNPNTIIEEKIYQLRELLKEMNELNPQGLSKEAKPILEQFLSEALQEAYTKGKEDTVSKLFEVIKSTFQEWAGASKYVTGSWNTGEEIESEHRGEYWDDQRRTAWEQFATRLDSKIAGMKIDDLLSTPSHLGEDGSPKEEAEE